MNNQLNENRRIWIAWQNHRRTQELCSDFSVDLFVLISKKVRIIKIIMLSVRSMVLLCLVRPHLLYIQNPSIFLALEMIMLRFIFRFRLIVDQHNEGIVQYNYSYRLYKILCSFIIRKADCNIVTNAALLDIVKQKGGRGVILPDKLPTFKKKYVPFVDGKFHYLVICTFCPDEPYREIIEAAKMMGSDVCIHITGRFEKIQDLTVADNTVLEGFISDEKYIELLSSVHAVIDLTKMDNCLVCGAYEAIAAEKPLITSDTKALREWFDKGTIYCFNTIDAIAKAMIEMKVNYEFYKRDVILAKESIEKKWSLLKGKALEEINALTKR